MQLLQEIKTAEKLEDPRSSDVIDPEQTTNLASPAQPSPEAGDHSSALRDLLTRISSELDNQLERGGLGAKQELCNEVRHSDECSESTKQSEYEDTCESDSTATRSSDNAVSAYTLDGKETEAETNSTSSDSAPNKGERNEFDAWSAGSDREFGEEAPLSGLRSCRIEHGELGSHRAKCWTIRNQGVERSLLRREDKNPQSATLGLTWEPPCKPAVSSDLVWLSVDGEGAPQYDVEVGGGTSEWRRLFALHELGCTGEFNQEDLVARRFQNMLDTWEQVFDNIDSDEESDDDKSTGKAQSSNPKHAKSASGSSKSASKNKGTKLGKKQGRQTQRQQPWLTWRVDP